MNRSLVVWVAALVLLTSGCVSANERHIRQMKERMDPLVGVWNYDNAISQWGAPTGMTEGGNVVVYVWEWDGGKSVVAAPVYGTVMSRTTSHGSRMTVTFRKEDAVMVAYRYSSW